MKTVRRLAVPLLIGVLVAMLAACGGDDDDDSGGGIPAPGGSTNSGSNDKPASSGGSSAKGSCEVKVTGDIQTTFTGTGGTGAVTSDYWYTDDEMKKILGILKSGDESVEDAMKKDPRLFLLLINCGTGANAKESISIMPSNGSKYADVPFKPGEYAIPVQGALGGAKKPGEFNVLLSVQDGVWKVSEAGTLKISKFDKTGIAGTFSFKSEETFAEGTPRKINVSGTFDFACPDGDNCKR